MGSRRIARVEELIKRELSMILQHELKDPRIGFVTVSRVKVSGDIRHAKAFISVMGEQRVREETMEGLQSSAGYIQKTIGSRVKLKFTPRIEYFLDDSLDHGFHIMELLDKINRESGEGE